MAAKQIRRSIVLDASPEDVWPWLVEAERELAWRTPEVTELQPLEGGPLGTGSQFRGAIRIAGKRDTWVNELTVVDEPKQLAWRTVEDHRPGRIPWELPSRTDSRRHAGDDRTRPGSAKRARPALAARHGACRPPGRRPVPPTAPGTRRGRLRRTDTSRLRVFRTTWSRSR